jgi:hypothetical protein
MYNAVKRYPYAQSIIKPEKSLKKRWRGADLNDESVPSPDRRRKR